MQWPLPKWLSRIDEVQLATQWDCGLKTVQLDLLAAFLPNPYSMYYSQLVAIIHGIWIINHELLE
jgi:hypothetical protein